jgi:putative oxidoreductase
MSTVKPVQTIARVASILLGLIYLFFGLNFFFHFLQAVPADPSSKAGIFLAGLFSSGYFFIFLKTLEVLCGILFIADWFVPLVLILVSPISVNIFLFHVILAPAAPALFISFLIIILNIYLAWAYRHVYAPLLKRNNALDINNFGFNPPGRNTLSH